MNRNKQQESNMAEMTRDQILDHAEIGECHVCGCAGRHCAGPDGLVQDDTTGSGYLCDACDDTILCADDGARGHGTSLICDDCYEERMERERDTTDDQ
jgi:hypothetical protein